MKKINSKITLLETVLENVSPPKMQDLLKKYGENFKSSDPKAYTQFLTYLVNLMSKNTSFDDKTLESEIQKLYGSKVAPSGAPKPPGQAGKGAPVAPTSATKSKVAAAAEKAKQALQKGKDLLKGKQQPGSTPSEKEKAGKDLLASLGDLSRFSKKPEQPEKFPQPEPEKFPSLQQLAKGEQPAQEPAKQPAKSGSKIEKPFADLPDIEPQDSQDIQDFGKDMPKDKEFSWSDFEKGQDEKGAAEPPKTVAAKPAQKGTKPEKGQKQPAKSQEMPKLATLGKDATKDAGTPSKEPEKGKEAEPIKPLKKKREPKLTEPQKLKGAESGSEMPKLADLGKEEPVKQEKEPEKKPAPLTDKEKEWRKAQIAKRVAQKDAEKNKGASSEEDKQKEKIVQQSLDKADTTEEEEVGDTRELDSTVKKSESWKVGDKVRVGALKDLFTVIAKGVFDIPTSGGIVNNVPAYTLRSKYGEIYIFVGSRHPRIDRGLRRVIG